MDKNTSELRAVQQAIETIEENIQWMDKNLEKIKTWLQINSKVWNCMFIIDSESTEVSSQNYTYCLETDRNLCNRIVP